MGFIIRVKFCVSFNCSIYEGEDCELDYDGCEDDPCGVDRNCTDKNATVHQHDVEVLNLTNSSPYICGSCPDGKCEGKKHVKGQVLFTIKKEVFNSRRPRKWQNKKVLQVKRYL